MTAISFNGDWPGADGRPLIDAVRDCGLLLVVTLDGKPQRKVVWVSPETGELAVLVLGENGRPQADESGRRAKTEKRSGKIGFVVEIFP